MEEGGRRMGQKDVIGGYTHFAALEVEEGDCEECGQPLEAGKGKETDSP